jgi:glyoxylase-like metal-dependent hydrolase (beta-lactamase superfamily II)
MKAKFLPLFTLALLLVAASAAAETVAGLPLHVQKLAPEVVRVWLGDHISSTATVAFATEKGILVIDTLGSPEIDRELRGVIARELGRDDFALLINTHEHGDHTGGNVVYADCEIVGHELVAEGMVPDEAMRPRMIEWLTTRVAELEEEIAQLAADAPEAAKLKEDLIQNRLSLADSQQERTLVPPTRTFSDRLVLDMGDTTFELYYIGGMHSASDIAVLVPEHGLLLTGDTMADVWLTDTPGCLASFGARPGVRHDFPLWLENWRALLARKDEIKRLLPGHWNGELSLAGCEARVKYVETLWNEAVRSAAAGGGLDGMLADYTLESKFPDLVDSPGCGPRGNFMTVAEIWKEATGQTSAAETLYTLIDEGADESEIRAVVAQREAASPTYYFLEADINGWGYRFLQNERPTEAVAMFRINVELFPDAWNCYDSLGEALLASGEREEAIAMYERSLELNPDNANGREVLERVRSEAVN